MLGAIAVGSYRLMGRRPKEENEPDFVPITPYQRWLEPVLKRRGWKVADLARALSRDYNYVYKIARGNPNANEGKNNVPARPGYEIAYEIGEALGDVIGSLRAADYPVPQQAIEIRSGVTVDIFTPDGKPLKLTITEKELRRLLLEAELQQEGTERG